MLDRDQILSTWHGWVTPLPAWRATAENRNKALHAFECARLLGDVRRNGARGDLLVLYRAATGAPPWSPGALHDDVLMAAIESAISKRELLLIPASAVARPTSSGAPRTPAQTQQDSLIQSVMKDRPALSFEGRRYRFTPADSWGGPQDPREYVPIRQEQARDLVARMADAQADSPADRAAWQAVAAALTDPRSGPGILLLRYAPPSGAPTPRADVPVVTPSQLAPKLAELDFIEIEIQYDDGTPYDGNCLVALPGGRTTEGPPDGGGVVRVDKIDPGDCTLSFPDLAN